MLMRKNAKKFAAFALAVSFFSSIGIGKVMDNEHAEYTSEQQNLNISKGEKVLLYKMLRNAATSLNIKDRDATEVCEFGYKFGILKVCEIWVDMSIREESKKDKLATTFPLSLFVAIFKRTFTCNPPSNIIYLTNKEIKQVTEDFRSRRLKQELGKIFGRCLTEKEIKQVTEDFRRLKRGLDNLLERHSTEEDFEQVIEDFRMVKQKVYELLKRRLVNKTFEQVIEDIIVSEREDFYVLKSWIAFLKGMSKSYC